MSNALGCLFDNDAYVVFEIVPETCAKMSHTEHGRVLLNLLEFYNTVKDPGKA